MERKDNENVIAEILSEFCEAEPLEMHMKIKEDCGLDSLSMVALLVEIEERMRVTFDDGDLDPEKLVTLEDLVCLTWKYASGNF